jgi:hypothetical protein
MSLGPILIPAPTSIQKPGLLHPVRFLVRLLHLCVQFEISRDDIDTIEAGMASRVQEFEK